MQLQSNCGVIPKSKIDISGASINFDKVNTWMKQLKKLMQFVIAKLHYNTK
jgi:Tfp pilus assembly protein PilN